MACFIRGRRQPERAIQSATSGSASSLVARVAGPMFPGVLFARAVLLCVLALGCNREAPGPEECVAFAEAWLKTHPPTSLLVADHAFDELVRHCLTEPYDRELVSCVVAGSHPERCRVAYARRVETRREERLR
jgi:hypothetical protein